MPNLQVKNHTVTLISVKKDDLIRNWLRNRNTIEFLGIWEVLNNPSFKPVEFDGFKMQAGLNSKEKKHDTRK